MLNGQLQKLSDEVNRLNQLLVRRLQEMQDWENKFTALQYTVASLRAFEETNKQLQDKFNSTLQLCDDLRRKVAELEFTLLMSHENEYRLQEADMRIEQLTAELARVTALANSKLIELDALYTKIAALEDENFKLS